MRGLITQCLEHPHISINMQNSPESQWEKIWKLRKSIPKAAHRPNPHTQAMFQGKGGKKKKTWEEFSRTHEVSGVQLPAATLACFVRDISDFPFASVWENQELQLKSSLLCSCPSTRSIYYLQTGSFFVLDKAPGNTMFKKKKSQSRIGNLV